MSLIRKTTSATIAVCCLILCSCASTKAPTTTANQSSLEVTGTSKAAVNNHKNQLKIDNSSVTADEIVDDTVKGVKVFYYAKKARRQTFENLLLCNDILLIGDSSTADKELDKIKNKLILKSAPAISKDELTDKTKFSTINKIDVKIKEQFELVKNFINIEEEIYKTTPANDLDDVEKKAILLQKVETLHNQSVGLSVQIMSKTFEIYNLTYEFEEGQYKKTENSLLIQKLFEKQIAHSFSIVYQNFNSLYMGNFKKINAEQLKVMTKESQELKVAALAELKILVTMNAYASAKAPDFKPSTELNNKIVDAINYLDDITIKFTFQLTAETDPEKEKFADVLNNFSRFAIVSDELRHQYVKASTLAIAAMTK